MKNILFTLLLTGLIFQTTFAQKNNVVSRLIGNDRLGKKDSVANWSIHAQITTIYQYHPGFKAAYSGANSMNSHAEGAVSLTSTIFLGRKLWKGATIYFNPELSGGSGLSHTLGVAGFPNGETYRVGNPAPTPFLARLYLQQVIRLGKSADDFLLTDNNQLAGKIPSSRIVITMGRFCLSDFFDDNSYSHDARSQFMNWSLMAAGAWDFPADTRGYTEGLVLEFIKPKWAVRLATVLEPQQANGIIPDWRWDKANSETAEYERDWKIKGMPGAVRTTGYISFTRAPYYKDAIAAIETGDSVKTALLVGVISSKQLWNTYGGIKYGFGLNAEQAVNDVIGVFARGNWNDGHSATWAFTEIDNSAEVGLSMTGHYWKRPTDVFGVAEVVNGISPLHRKYLGIGGYGFILGDGALHYAPEASLEVYYKAQIASFIAISVDYQLVANPGYNKDRGPVHVPGIRLHLEI